MKNGTVLHPLQFFVRFMFTAVAERSRHLVRRHLVTLFKYPDALDEDVLHRSVQFDDGDAHRSLRSFRGVVHVYHIVAGGVNVGIQPCPVLRSRIHSL